MTPAGFKAARLSPLTKSGRPLTQRQLASIMDLDSVGVSRVECGTRPAPVRYERLLLAYHAQFKPNAWPKDWPE